MMWILLLRPMKMWKKNSHWTVKMKTPILLKNLKAC